MSSIGNDIIALKTTDITRTQNPRFYSKILSPAEQQLYKDSCPVLPFHHFVWLLWSAKESAYKCLQRLQPDLLFSPVKIAVTHIDLPENTPLPFPGIIENTGFNYQGNFKSVIQYKSQTLYARSVIYSDELIQTVVLLQDDFENVCWGIKKTEQSGPGNQSAEIRSFLLDRMRRSVYSSDDLSVEKSVSGYPYITYGGKELLIPVSISHHDNYVGYAMLGLSS